MMIYTEELTDSEEAMMMHYIENLQMMKRALMMMIMLMRWSGVQYKDPTEVRNNEITDDSLKSAKWNENYTCDFCNKWIK